MIQGKLHSRMGKIEDRKIQAHTRKLHLFKINTKKTAQMGDRQTIT
jgi:hypothetical protein